MNKQILFKSALSLVAAVAAGSAFAAATSVLDVDFESFSADYAITNAEYWAADGADESKVAGDSSNKYLDLKTEGSTLTRTLDQASTLNTALSGGTLTVDNPAVFSAEVKFVPSDTADCGLAGGTDDTKFAIFACAQDNGPTNLVVFHRNGPASYTNEEFTVSSVNFDDWTKVSVKMFDTTDGLFFTVALNDGAPLTPAQTSYTDPGGDCGYPATWFKTVNDEELDEGNKQFSAICFKGTGAVDDLKVDLGEAEPTTFTVTLNAGTLSPYSLTTNGVAVSPVPASIVVDPNTEVVFGVSNTDGAVKTYTVTPTADYTLDASGATFGWPEYLGAADATDGFYSIDDANDLDMLRKGVVAGLTTSGETFKQTADIDMTSAGAFAGIGTYAKVPTGGTPFLGTYDGDGYTIANVTRAGENTQGIFNQVGPSGVIENLVVSNMVAASGISGFGFAIVGNAGGGATLRNLTAAGTFASVDNPGQHNMAGIVVRLSPGATAGVATTIDSCTNNATIYGKYTKIGGICAIVQIQGDAFKLGKVVFTNCANNGTLVSKRTAAEAAQTDGAITGIAGIVGYSSAIVELTGCYGNGDIINADGANTDKDGALVGYQYSGYAFTDNGGNSAPTNKKMIAYYGNYSNVTGFKYATVDNGVATTISGSIAADGEYLLEGNAAPVIELADGESIAFDTALGYTLNDTGITAATGCDLSDATVGTVTTYTAAAPAPAGWVDDPATVSNQTAAVAYPTLASTALAAADAQKLTVWAKANSVAFDSAEAATESMVEAYLLNCAPTPAAIVAEKDAFVLDIEFDATGAAVIKLPEGKTYNGTLQMKGSNDLSTWTPTATTQGFQFFKYELSL